MSTASAQPTAEPEPPAARPAWRAVATFSRGVARIPHLPALLGAERVVLRPDHAAARELDAVVGWGEKANTELARRYAERHGLPYWRAEDGFLRSIGVGSAGDPPLSLVLDDRGIYYDARRPSRLEHILETGAGLSDPALLARARRAIDRIVEAALSKYNDSPPDPPDLGPRTRPRVLVVDQTAGDLSIACGLATAESFSAMLAAARAEHPDAELIVKIHPDVLAGAKRGHLERAAGPDVRVIGEPANPIELLRQVDRVYAVTSQLGFEALLLGLPVTCFGAPFYAGWGLTDDRGPALPRRTQRRTLEELFAAAYLLYPRYIDPDTSRPGQIEDVIEHLALQRREFSRNRGRIVCFGFRVWKRSYVRAYLRCPQNQVVFAHSARHAEALGFDRSCKALVWGQRAGADVAALAERHGVPLWRMEDGFLRSVGLGSDLAAPASLVVDQGGIYYDPRTPSELERILQTAEFSPADLERARRLRERIIATRLSKYNVGHDRPVDVPPDRQVVLVPGQVEDDASIQLGCLDVRTNRALLVAARAACPDAYLIFKPHPDVLSGNRQGHVADAASLCDHIETRASLADCLSVAHEVHTMTSLVGFEGLLREKRVVAYGQPFYAGWGLTADRHPPARRTRRLSLDELVAGTLLRYPRYLSTTTGRFTTPEVVLDQLAAARDADPSARTIRVSWPRRQLRKLVYLYKGVTGAP